MVVFVRNVFTAMESPGLFTAVNKAWVQFLLYFKDPRLLNS